MKIIFNHDYGFVKNERVFCEVYGFPDNETYDELLDSGWLPSMEDKNVWYQSKSCRLNIEDFIVTEKIKNFKDKINFSIENYDNQKFIDNFFKRFYKEKNFDIYDLYDNCSKFFEIKVLSLKYNNELVALARFIECEYSNLLLSHSYITSSEVRSLGNYLLYLLEHVSKIQNKKYLYLYESYDDIFSYKQKFNNSEIWNGINWLKINGKS